MRRILTAWIVIPAHIFAPSIAIGALSELDKSLYTEKNRLANPGWEASKAGWTASGGTYTTTTTAANIGSGNAAGSWDSSGASQTLTSASVTVTSGAGLSSQNGAVSCRIKAASGTATHTIQAYDGTNILVSSTITSSTSGFVRTSANFVFPSSGTVSLRLVSVAADEPTVYVDDCYLGLADGFNITNINPVGNWTSYTPSITWASNATPTGHYRRVGDTLEIMVNIAVTGAVSGTLDVGLPSGLTIDTTKLNVGSAPEMTGQVMVFDSGTATYHGVVGYQNGDTDSVRPFYFLDTGALEEHNTLTATTPMTFASGDAVWLHAKVPISGWMAETAYRPDIMPGSWSGYHSGATCSWARTSAALGSFTADADCTLVEQVNNNFGTVSTSGSVLPAITFTPKRAGRYHVTAVPMVHSNNASQSAQLRLTDGTTNYAEIEVEASSNARRAPTLGAVVNATSTASITLEIYGATTSGAVNVNTNGAMAIKWNIVALDQSFPAPVLVGSVTSASTGAERIERAEIRYSGGTPSVFSQSGSWISSVTDVGTGQASPQISGFSSAPVCVCSSKETTASGAICLISGTSATQVQIRLRDNAGTLLDEDFTLICMGPR